MRKLTLTGLGPVRKSAVKTRSRSSGAKTLLSSVQRNRTKVTGAAPSSEAPGFARRYADAKKNYISKNFFSHSISRGILCPVLIVLAILTGLLSCSKQLSTVNSGIHSAATTSTSPTIAVAVDSVTGDSIYVLQPCAHGYFRDSIASSALPGTTTAYLNGNYSGYIFQKAYVIKDSAGTTGGYVVIITYNGKPVALLFDGSGNFVQVLEQRQSGDLDGRGWHEGGRFRDRDGLHKDTVALSALPPVILSYMTSNYPQDTLVKAYLNFDSTFLVISKDNGLFATLFTNSGTFIKRVELPAPSGSAQTVAQADLPAASLTFLTNTFPNYVFEKAFSVTLHGTLQGYEVIIDANNSKYGVVFDASGKFIAAGIIW